MDESLDFEASKILGKTKVMSLGKGEFLYVSLGLHNLSKITKDHKKYAKAYAVQNFKKGGPQKLKYESKVPKWLEKRGAIEVGLHSHFRQPLIFKNTRGEETVFFGRYDANRDQPLFVGFNLAHRISEKDDGSSPSFMIDFKG